jgi:hypothetical protein
MAVKTKAADIAATSEDLSINIDVLPMTLKRSCWCRLPARHHHAAFKLPCVSKSRWQFGSPVERVRAFACFGLDVLAKEGDVFRSSKASHPRAEHPSRDRSAAVSLLRHDNMQ